MEGAAPGPAVDHPFDRSPIRVGRSPRNDLCLPQRFVSAWHGRIDVDGGRVSYTDLGSTNGTLHNGSPLDPRSAARLGARAVVSIGPLRVTVPNLTAVVSAVPTAMWSRVMVAAAPAGAAGAPTDGRPRVAPGGITAVMKRLAGAPSDDFERAWRRVLVPGAVMGRFELVREVGRGSFGVVFEARDRQLGRMVAFKAVRPGRESQVVFRQEVLQREAEAAAQLNHPNIVSLYDVGACESGPYLIMELLRGETLRDRLRRGRLPLQEALEIAIEVAWALDHAHGAGVIHRDLKPANVFLTSEGRVKLLDYGLAHVFGAGSRRAVGTPAYMAPEQWREGPQDTRTDVFGAAATFAETLTGKLPYRVTEESSSVLEPGARPDLSGAELPPLLAALLRRALAPDPAVRPRDGHAWLAALLEIHELVDRAPPVGAPPRRARSPAPTREPRPGDGEALRRPRLGDIAVMTLIAAAAVAAVALLLLR